MAETVAANLKPFRRQTTCRISRFSKAKKPLEIMKTLSALTFIAVTATLPAHAFTWCGDEFRWLSPKPPYSREMAAQPLPDDAERVLPVRRRSGSGNNRIGAVETKPSIGALDVETLQAEAREAKRV